MGWLCVLGWQTGCASTSFMVGTMVQGLIALNHPDTYVHEGWHGTLLTIAAAAFAAFFNTFLARHLPAIESGLLVIHVFAFFGILATLWAMSPTADAAVFTQFNDGGGWGSLGVSTLAGITSGVLPLLGADAAAHMVSFVFGLYFLIPWFQSLSKHFKASIGCSQSRKSLMRVSWTYLAELGRRITRPKLTK